MDNPLDPIELMRTLVGFDTINSPGNERPCAEHLGRPLKDGGFSVSYHEFAEHRSSLVARTGASRHRIALFCAPAIEAATGAYMPYILP